MKTPEIKLPETLPARDALVAAAKDMNTILALDPKIKTKGLDDKALAEQVALYAKGWDEESNAFNPEYAVSYEDKVSQKLSPSTFETLIALGAVAPKSEKPKKEKKAKASLEDGEEVKVKKASTGTRNKGIRLTTWETLSKQLKAVDPTKEKCVATVWDHLLTLKMSMAERNAKCEDLGIKPVSASHISWRYGQGYEFTDGRKHSKDMTSKVYISGYDPEKKGTVFKFPEEPPAPVKEKKAKKEKVSAKVDDEEIEAPVKTKKVKKEKVVEAEEAPAPVKKDKKAKKSKE